MNLSARIPLERALPLIERVRAAFPQVKQVPPLVNITRQVWERMHIRPPGILASLLLLAIYAGTFLGTPIVAVLFQMPIRSVVSETRADGSSGRRQEIRSWGRLRETTELNPSGRFHGRHVEYSLLTGRVKTEGAYAKGLPDGVWTTYGEDGQVQSRATYKLGRIVGPAIAP